jgi:hypothetical protein
MSNFESANVLWFCRGAGKGKLILGIWQKLTKI